MRKSFKKIESIDIFMILSILLFTIMIVSNIIKYGIPNG
jgi:hypothetical protein